MKAGGVKFADTPEEAARHAEHILDLEIGGHMPRGVLVDVPDAELGSVRMAAPTPRLAATPATIRSTGPSLGAHNRDVYGALGLDEAELEALTRDGVI